MSPADGPTSKDRWLAALAIGALAVSGAMGAMRSINGTCAMPTNPGLGGAPIAPLSAPGSPIAPDWEAERPRD